MSRSFEIYSKTWVKQKSETVSDQYLSSMTVLDRSNISSVHLSQLIGFQTDSFTRSGCYLYMEKTFLWQRYTIIHRKKSLKTAGLITEFFLDT